MGNIALCCDSLSNLYLWHIKYSPFSTNLLISLVVIRFQICIFDILNTAPYINNQSNYRCDSLSNLYLWHIKYSAQTGHYITLLVVIRFQICIFDILNTADMEVNEIMEGCDSLSNLYLWHIKYSPKRREWVRPTVVIRFQICIFDILNTAQ